MDPWEILGLSNEERDLQEIKRAYAREIKKYRPQSHPVEFRIRRDAYEAIVQILKIEKDTGLAIDANRGDGVELKNVASNAETEAETEKSPEEEAAYQYKNQYQADIAINPSEEIPKANKLFVSGEIPVIQWQGIVLKQSENDPNVLLKYVGDIELFKELDSNSDIITYRIFQDRINHGEYDIAAHFAEQWAQTMDRTAYINVLEFSMKLITDLALVKIATARIVYKRSIDFITARERDSFMVLNAEMYLQAGAEMEAMPETVRIFLAQLINGNQWGGDTQSAFAERVFDKMAYVHGDSVIRQLLNRSSPEFIDACDEYYHARDYGHAQWKSAQHKNSGSVDEPIKIPWLALVVGMIVLSRFVGMDFGSSNQYKPQDLHELMHSEAFLEQIEEMKKSRKENPERKLWDYFNEETGRFDPLPQLQKDAAAQKLEQELEVGLEQEQLPDADPLDLESPATKDSEP